MDQYKIGRPFTIISLTLRNAGLPLGDGLVADRERIGKLALGESAVLASFGDGPTLTYFPHCHHVR